MIISKTPLRISLVGGGSDLPAFCSRDRGRVVSCTIDKYVYVVVHDNFDGRVRAKYSRYEDCATIAEIQNPIIREALLWSKRSGVDIASFADIPEATGLGSSSAFTVGLLHALERSSFSSDAEALADAACYIEITRCGFPIGRQDQFAAACGGFNSLSFTGEVVHVSPLAVPATRSSLADWSMLFWLGTKRPNGDVLREQAAGMDSNRFRMRIMVGMVDSACRAIFNGAWAEVGEILNEAWHIKRTLAEGITNAEIDDAYRMSRRAGAIGGKVCGAGGRGFLYLIARPERHEVIRQSLSQYRHVPFQFTNQGSVVLHAD